MSKSTFSKKKKRERQLALNNKYKEKQVRLKVAQERTTILTEFASHKKSIEAYSVALGRVAEHHPNVQTNDLFISAVKNINQALDCISEVEKIIETDIVAESVDLSPEVRVKLFEMTMYGNAAINDFVKLGEFVVSGKAAPANIEVADKETLDMLVDADAPAIVAESSDTMLTSTKETIPQILTTINTNIQNHNSTVTHCDEVGFIDPDGKHILPNTI